MDLGHNIALGVLNISQTGVRILVNCDLPVRQEVTLTMESYDRPRPLRILGDVIWCRPDGERWEVGIQLQKRLDFRDFLKLTAMV
jgi:hypothetical protein